MVLVKIWQIFFAIRDEFNLEDYDNIAVGYWLTRGEPDKMVQELL